MNSRNCNFVKMRETKGIVSKLKVNDKMIYRWSIPNFCFDSMKIGEKLISPVFPIQNTNWQLELYPKGLDELFDQYMSLFLKLESKLHVNNNQAIKFQLSILDCNKKKYAAFEVELGFADDENYTSGKSDFIKQTEMKLNKSAFLPNDTLTICCEITPIFSRKENQPEDLKKRKRLRLESTSESPNESNTLYAKFFDNEQYSDVKFVTADDRYVHAHKVFLIDKGEVFADLFSANRPVLSPNVINMRDVDYQAMYETFRFVYTGEVKDIEKHVEELLRMARKFKIDDLKKLCEKHLSDSLCVANAVELLYLAEDYDLWSLKEKTKHFVALNMRDYVDSPDFKELMKYYPETADEIVKCSVE